MAGETPAKPEVSAGGGDAAGTTTTTAFIVEGEDRDTTSCAGRQGLNLKGELLNDGASLIKDKVGDCCQDCIDLPECNVWVYCEGDCVDYAYHSCWLKRAMTGFNMEAPAAWAASSDVPWTSGWFAPKAGLVATTTPAPTAGEARQDAANVSDAGVASPALDANDPTTAAAGDEAVAAEEPDVSTTPAEPQIRVVPVGGAAEEEAADALGDASLPAGTSNATNATSEPEVVVEEDGDGGLTFTLVPGEPLTIPASMITILPGGDLPENVELAPAGAGTAAGETQVPPTGGGALGEQPPAQTSNGAGTPSATAPSTPASTTTAAAPVAVVAPRRDPAAITCENATVSACPAAGVVGGANADPLGTARVRGSFQLLRARSAETGGTRAESLTLLRPGDEVDEIFVTGTLINANRDAVCLSNLEVPFDFPRTVVLAPTAAAAAAPGGVVPAAAQPQLLAAAPEDFVVSCYYVGVRSREASAAPGTAAAAASAFAPATPDAAPPRACEDTVALAMTEEGPILAFREDVALCAGCWLVGGRDGVLFSWKHKDGLPMRVSAGDAVGDKAARCADTAK